MSKVKPMTSAGNAPLESSGIEEKLTGKFQAVGSIVGRSAEVTETLERNVGAAALQEVRYKNEGTKILSGDDCVYKLFWKGDKNGQGGVGTMVKQEVVESVTKVRRVSPRILSANLVLSEKVVTIISVYRPQSRRSVEEKEKFYDDLTAEVWSRKGICVVLGDFNGHVGRSVQGYAGVHGGFGWGERNRDGERILRLLIVLT